MQPYAFPYLGYYQLINYADQWVVFDDVQYITRGWINRNRILHPESEKEWQYFTIPARKHNNKTLINAIEINHELQWKQELLGKLSFYRKKAPFYQEAVNLVEDCLDFDSDDLSPWLVSALEKTCEYLGIPFRYSIFSRSEIDVAKIEHAGHWALEIADSMGANEYVNPPGGVSIFKEREFLDRGIELQFLRPKLNAYAQKRHSFVPGLSILDVIMWNEPDSIRLMLGDFDLLSSAQLQGEHNE
jgi:hypothetical protein